MSGSAVCPRAAEAVNGHEIWIAPVWNPDGYSHVFASDNLWRKNRRVFAGNASGGAYGAYHMFLPPGTYDIRFSAPGYAPTTSRVTVTATSGTVVDVALSPLDPTPPHNLRIVG